MGVRARLDGVGLCVGISDIRNVRGCRKSVCSCKRVSLYQ